MLGGRQVLSEEPALDGGERDGAGDKALFCLGERRAASYCLEEVVANADIAEIILVTGDQTLQGLFEKLGQSGYGFWPIDTGAIIPSERELVFEYAAHNI